MIDPIIRQDLESLRGSVPIDSLARKRALISGGAGFLGSWICDVLVSGGASVVCLDNLSTGSLENVEHLKGARGFEFDKGDVSSYNGRRKVDWVFHLASRPAPEDYQKHPVETALANSEGTEKMLELARRSDSRVLYASSSEVYGDPEVFPTPESYPGRVDPLGPRSCYEEGKRFGEALCKAYIDQYGLDVRIARVFNSYGPRLRADGFYGRVISRFILQALNGEDLTVFGDGSQTRSFCYVTDTVRGLLLEMGRDRLKGKVVNVGSQEETRIIDLAKMITQSFPGKSRIRFLPFPAGDHRRRLPDIAKARKLIEWQPSVRLQQGLARTHEWFRNRGSSP